ncbi:MAG: N-acetylmuramoyl-L-alanine amidase [Bacteroidota bacterium]|jgi:N-acetylmuramoyl-L-alanine amidase
MMKRIFTLLFTFYFSVFSCLSDVPGKKTGYKIRTIVIDAGHGGHDTGCLGSDSREKEVALRIALKLGKLIESNCPDVKVIYTRKTDVFIPLIERANIANRAKADLFICIHLNSGPKSAFGAETFVMGLHKTEDNLSVAKRENAAILLEDNYQKNYDGFDPSSPEANIIFSLYQNQFMTQSLNFAAKIQKQFKDNSKRYSRGVKQAGFLVLYKTAMPSVLIENGFLTNDNDQRFLVSDAGQASMASSIYRAFKSYKSELETGIVSNDKIEDQDNFGEGKSDTNKNDQIVTTNTSFIDPKTDTEDNSSVKSVDTTKTVQSDKKDTGNAKTDLPKEKVTTTTNATDNKSTTKSDVDYSKLAFITVQVGAVKEGGAISPKIKDLKTVFNITFEDGYTRYFVGHFSTIADAKVRLEKLKDAGFKDAFLVAYDHLVKVKCSEVQNKK